LIGHFQGSSHFQTARIYSDIGVTGHRLDRVADIHFKFWRHHLPAVPAVVSTGMTADPHTPE
jgi:hypothetical protein